MVGKFTILIDDEPNKQPKKKREKRIKKKTQNQLDLWFLVWGNTFFIWVVAMLGLVFWG